MFHHDAALLTFDEAQLFFKLHRSLMFFVEAKLQVLPSRPASPQAYSSLPAEDRQQVHEAFLEEVTLLEAFVDENPSAFTEEELEIVASWRHMITGQFFILRQLKRHAIFLTSGDPPTAYGVVGLSQRFEDLLQSRLPAMSKTVLLPFCGKIVYDGLLLGHNIHFGPGIRRVLEDDYRRAKEHRGIITSLSPPDHPVPKKRTSRAPQGTSARSIRGRWAISRLDRQVPESLDEYADAYLEFGPNQRGTLQMSNVRGDIDYRLGVLGTRPSVEFSWDGAAGSKAANGRGSASADGAKLSGTIFVHGGDDIPFEARRTRR